MVQATAGTLVHDTQDGQFVEQFGKDRLTGRRCLPDLSRCIAGAPLVIAVHGGTYSSLYFDLPGHSLVDRAGSLGIPIIALDRPGYGETTPLEERTETTARQGQWLNDIVGELFRRHGEGAPGVVLIGHSVGAATVVEASVLPRIWPLLGIAVSGICLLTPQASKDHWNAMPQQTWVEMAHDVKDAVMFGPQNTISAEMPGASHAAHSLVPRAELLDIVAGYPDRERELLRQIDVPVHYRQGEFDPLWITDEAQVREFASELTSAPHVDAALFKGAGHCIDLHLLGASFQLEQLAFSLRCGAEPIITANA
jgi:pimeloyl-ACP methyl ester carboxylesterase